MTKNFSGAFEPRIGNINADPFGGLHIDGIFDCFRRYLEYKGLKVTFVRNVTDVDDKIIEKARTVVSHQPPAMPVGCMVLLALAFISNFIIKRAHVLVAHVEYGLDYV